LKERIAELLRDEGFIAGFTVVTEAPRSWVEIDLRYDANDEPLLQGSKRVSRPGLRVYTRAREIPRVMGGIGVALVSTSSGLMTGSEARRRKLGGEVLAFVW
jgi:small subunit ribosomal protein S8